MRLRTQYFQGYRRKSMRKFQGSIKKEKEFPGVFKIISCGISIGLGICSSSPVLNGRLPFWQDSSRPAAVSPWKVSRFEMILAWMSDMYKFSQVYQTFYKLDVKILAASDEIRCVRCSWPPSSSSSRFACQQKYCFGIIKNKRRECQEWVSE